MTPGWELLTAVFILALGFFAGYFTCDHDWKRAMKRLEKNHEAPKEDA